MTRLADLLPGSCGSNHKISVESLLLNRDDRQDPREASNNPLNLVTTNYKCFGENVTAHYRICETYRQHHSEVR